MVLEGCSAALAADWVARWRRVLREEQRPMRGGWPGTKAEARARVARYLATEITKLRLPAPSDEQIALAASNLYATARRAWLAESSGGEDDGTERDAPT